MPIQYQIDHARRLVSARVCGTLTPQEIFKYQYEVWSSPSLDGYNEVMDMTEVLRFELPSHDFIQQIANLAADMDNPAKPSKFAIIAPGDEAFGLGRMYQTHRSMVEGATRTVGVFRERAKAFEFLGIQDPHKNKRSKRKD